MFKWFWTIFSLGAPDHCGTIGLQHKPLQILNFLNPRKTFSLRIRRLKVSVVINVLRSF